MDRTTVIEAIVGCIVIFILTISIVLRMNRNVLVLPDKQKQNITSITPDTSKFITQKNEEGNVTVIAIPEILTIYKPPIFKLTFDTHTVDLSFNVAAVSKLIDDTGKIYINVRWDGTPPGGHHRTGTLVFQEPLQQTKYVDLVIMRVSGIQERRMRWKL